MDDELHKEEGPLLLLAGPGTGKTYRLGKRIKYLIEDCKVSPNQITVITFTAAAAKQMRDRISNRDEEELYLDSANQPSSIRTMHSLGMRIIGDERANLPFSCEHVVTISKQQTLLCEDGSKLAGFARKDAKLALDARRFGESAPQDAKVSAIVTKYQEILRACSAIDYDDQIFIACKVLRENAEILSDYRDQCRHLLVDEYQDINKAQFELITLLSAGNQKGLFVVGDDDQSIYSWRGGSPAFIRRFKEDFGDDAKIAPLLVSYRCHEHILEGASAVVAKCDPKRLDKGNFTYKHTVGPKIQVHSAPSDEKEARIVCAIIRGALPKRDVLVLVPREGFAAALVSRLNAAKIGFSAQLSAPGDGLHALNHLGDWLGNQSDSLSFRLCLDNFLNAHKGVPSIKARKEEKINQREEILRIVSELWVPVIEKKVDSLWAALLKSQSGDKILKEARESFLRIKELFDAGDTAQFVAEATKALGLWSSPSEMISEVAEWISAFDRSTPHGQAAGVRIMTFQGSKGLEASVVCVLGVEEGTLPRGSLDPENLPEQARLFYVSATRAKNELHLFHARKRSGAVVFRNIYGKGAPDLKESQFLVHIDKAHKDTRYHPA